MSAIKMAKRLAALAVMALATATGLTACGVNVPADLTVDQIREQVQDDLEKFSKQYDDKRVTVTGYYVGKRGLDPALGSDPEQEASDPGVFVVTFEDAEVWCQFNKI
jgi:ABC-type glycerol-3-phosphate transport system substrate-binding protein